MQKPSKVVFSGLTLEGSKLARVTNPGSYQMIDTSWARLTFIVPTAGNAIQDVHDWLAKNCNGAYSMFKFHDQRSYSDYQVVVRFEDKNDAILFKLQDGHRAWEHRDQ